MPDALLSTAEVASQLGISPRTVQRLVERGRLMPAQRLPAGRNGTYLYDPVEVRAYLARNAEAA